MPKTLSEVHYTHHAGFLWTLIADETLVGVQLQQNKLVGCLPSSWPTGLPKLGSLDVANNSLSGQIPSSYDTWTSLNTT